MSGFRVDEGPTTPGCKFYCNACPFETFEKERAIDHAIWAKQNAPFTHLLYERSGPPENGQTGRGARRRIVTYHSGLIQTELAPSPEERRSAAARRAAETRKRRRVA